MRILGLVTARGGSKGLPGKNLAPLAGRPLVRWSHRALADLRRTLGGAGVDLVLRLSTDDPAIATAWPEGDRPEDLRPPHLATDDATSLAVVEHELAAAAARGEACDAVLLLQPTSPLLTSADLTPMIERLNAGAESVALVAELDHPLAWSLSLDERGVTHAATGFDPRRRQTQSAAYRPVGCYLCTAGFVRTRGAFAVPGETVGVEVPRSRAIDIDDWHDLGTARALLGAERTASIAIGTPAGPRTIGEGRACFVIAEAGVNHNGDTDLAHRLVDAAADAGADAVKFQTFRASELVTGSAMMAAYQRTNLGAPEESSQGAMLRALELAEPALASLKAHAERRGLVFLSSPFDAESAHLLRGLGVGALKLGSGELTNHPMLAELSRMGLPLLISTGMATLGECEDAARVVRASGDPGRPTPVLWFHCVSAYPAPASASNLRAMDSLRDALGAPVGMSDHSMGDAVTLAAVARGAVAIEKHLTLSRAMEGPDHAASLEPDQFAEMVRKIRLVESALGDGVKAPAACEADTVRAARRSLVGAADLPAGHAIREGDLAAKRPGTGIPPSALDSIVGRTLARPLGADELLTEAHLLTEHDAADRSVA